MLWSGIAFSRYENFNLFFSANASFTKLCDDPESKSAWNGQRGLQAVWEVKDKKNELGERDMVFRQRQKALSMSWQPFCSAGHEGLPVSLPGLVLRAPRLLTLLALCWVCPAVPVS